MAEAVIKHVAGINHVASMNFREAVELAKHAEKAGADAVASYKGRGGSL